MARLLLVLVLIVSTMLLGSRLRGAPSAPAPAGQAPPPSDSISNPVAKPAPAGQPVQPMPVTPPDPGLARTMASGDLAPSPAASRTPIIARMARMEARRRLRYAGGSTYLDSLLASPDSTVRRWLDQTSIRVLIDPPEGAGHLVAAVRAGFQTWAVTSLGLTMTETSDSSEADIVVAWIDRFASAPTEPAAAARTGLSEIRADQAGEIGFVRITLARQDGQGHPLSEAALRAIAAHEFGHALGLPHSGQREDIMYPTVIAVGPSPRDRATLTLLYSLPFGSLREPPSP